MQTTSDLYKELLAAGAAKEVRLLIAGEEYGEDRICSLSTTGSIFSEDTLCVGSAVSRQIDVVLTGYGEIPKMAEMIPQYRLVDGDSASEWISKGVFYIDTRQEDKVAGTVTIHGFDAMLKGAVIWEPNQDLTFPMTFRSAAGVLANEMGVELDNQEDIDDSYQILDYPANDYTIRNVLQFIAAAHAANFIMTDTGRLRMVRINEIPPGGASLVTEDGNAITFGGVRIIVGDAEENNVTGTGEAVFVGDRVASSAVSPTFDPISKVIVVVDDENAWVAGDDSGFALKVQCPYGAQAMADNILAAVGGYVYRPYAADDAIVDQTAELGDGVTVDGIYSVLAQQDIVFDTLMAGRISAPGQREVESEYPYLTKEQQMEYRLAQTRTLITKTAEEIRLEVESVSGAVTSVKVTLDGLTVTTETGETLIDGGSVYTDNLYVSAANITGALTFDQLADDVQSDINDAYSMAADAESLANEAADAVSAWTYGSTTYIDGSKIMTGTVMASNLLGGSVGLLNASEGYVGELGITGASTANYAIDLTSYGALRFTAYGAIYISNSGTAIGLSDSDISVNCDNLYPVGTAAYLGNSSLGMWQAVYAYTATIQTSDANLKNSIETLDERYLRFILWLLPKRYKMNNGTSNRYHIGFIAQDVLEGMELFGIDSLEFAGFIRDVDADGNEILMLRYEEFIGLLALAVQDHEERLLKLEAAV